MKPKFNHPGCAACVFLGHFDGHDVYRCKTTGSFVARFGDDGNEYWTLMSSGVADMLGREDGGWAQSPQTRAIVAAICCDAVGEMPRQVRKFARMADVRHAVDCLWQDMLDCPDDMLPDPAWGLEPTTAFNHFYIAHSLLEQAGHHLQIAEAHNHECCSKYREQQETKEAENAGAQRLAGDHR